MNEEMIKDCLPLADQLKGTVQNKGFMGVLYANATDDYGNEILKEVSRNTVVLGGAIEALEHLANVDAPFKPATINQILNINPGITVTERPTIVLFGLGVGGAGLEFGSVLAKDIKSRDIPGMLPLRVGTEITGTHADKYYMKKLNDDGLTYSWYLKEFDADLFIKTLWQDSAEEDVDGTEILTEVYNSERTEKIESFIEMKIALNINDIREYYESIGELDAARYNTLGIYTGTKVQLADGSYDYVNVRLFAYTNFNNKDLTQKTESAYTYRIYSLV